jgi:hypothetical protein
MATTTATVIMARATTMARVRIERRTHMRTKTVLAVVLAFGLVGAFASIGHAGGGGAGNPGGILLFQCWGVEQGTRPAQVLSVDDQFTNPTRERPGKLKMVCAPSTFQVLNGLDVNADRSSDDHLTCYQADDEAETSSSVVTVTDGFTSQTVRVSGDSKFLCTTAIKHCVSGACTTHGGH